MPKAYDYDLRCKVIEAIELNGRTPTEVSEDFGISRNTIYQWFQIKAETGDVKPRPRKMKTQTQKIKDWAKFRAFVETHQDKTQAQMAQLWETQVSERTISRALNKLGLTRKKRPMAIENEMNKSALNLSVS